MLVEGLTERVAGLELTPLCVVPSDHATFHGPVPVNVAEIVVELPLQIVAEPLAEAVGRALTVTLALPLLEPKLLLPL